MPDDPDVSTTKVYPDRLNGWKEIAAYVGKSTRTAQRWERKLGLPVRRLRAVDGEIIYAFCSDIDAWQSTRALTEPADTDDTGAAFERDVADADAEDAADPARTSAPGTGTRHVGRMAIAVVTAFFLLFVMASIWRRPTPASPSAVRRNPASWSVQDNRLTVYDRNRAVLWHYDFGFPIDDDAYGPVRSAGFPPAVAFEDLEGDGAVETLFISRSTNQTESALYCFDIRGQVRFVHRATTPITFGDSRFDPPFPISQFIVDATTQEHKAIWVAAAHHLWFPTVVQKLSGSGRVLGEFWHAGHVVLLQRAQLGERPVMLVGATSNETLGATLAVLDLDNPTGAAPALDPRYRCGGCSVAGPLEYLIFPRMEISRELQTRPYVRQVHSSGNRFIITVLQAQDVMPGDGERMHCPVFYTTDSTLRILQAECGDLYVQAHSRLELLGRITHRFSPACARDLFPVLRWTGSAFERIEKSLVATNGNRLVEPPGGLPDATVERD